MDERRKGAIDGAPEFSEFIAAPGATDGLRAAISANYRIDETAAVNARLRRARIDSETRDRIARRARRLVREARKRHRAGGGLDAFLGEYALSSQEGVVLMCLAEALLRIPDAATADALIRDKLASAEWERHLGRSHSIFVNASTLGLMLTGRLVRFDSDAHDIGGYMGRLVARTGEPVIRRALMQAMRIMGHQFVMGRTIGEALKRAAQPENRKYRYSFDMLGEAARTARDAARYFDAYGDAIDALGRAAREAGTAGDIARAPGVSVKLSALHPRFTYSQRTRLMGELVPLLAGLVARARDAGIGLTVDTEEADRLDITLDMFGAVFAAAGSEAASGAGAWDGFGIAVQAYQKRAPYVIDWLVALAKAHRCPIPVRLVKGAYWDSEIKRAQELGLDSYPVYTRKSATDVSYIDCARRMIAAPRFLYPQFATHNAHTVALIQELVPEGTAYEFQRLHGMGEDLYGQIAGKGGVPCRVYAPVGSHEDLLPYLVRRLLENGANTSFVNRLADEAAPVEDIIADPVANTAAFAHKPHPRIPLPADIYGPARKGAIGIDLSDPKALSRLAAAMEEAGQGEWQAAPVIGGAAAAGRARRVYDPADRRRVIGTVAVASRRHVAAALSGANAAADGWDALGGAARADVLEAAAAEFEADMPALMAVLVREGGKTIADAVAELRETVDFCRYYAMRARTEFAVPDVLPGPTGETNTLALHGRGVFACISPWNFPLAIFTGQVAAALAAGNAVIAKPAEQTTLAAAMATLILHRAGVPGDVLQLLPGNGEVGAALVADEGISGVAFNRAMTGAVVGVQPFGGEGLSGTGPKAGGPRYLHRFAVERVLSVNTTAIGGNATLLTLDEED